MKAPIIFPRKRIQSKKIDAITKSTHTQGTIALHTATDPGLLLFVCPNQSMNQQCVFFGVWLGKVQIRVRRAHSKKKWRAFATRSAPRQNINEFHYKN